MLKIYIKKQQLSIIYALILSSLPLFVAAEPQAPDLSLDAKPALPFSTCNYVPIDLLSLYSLATEQGEVVGTLEKVTANIDGKPQTVALIYKNKIAYTNPDVAKVQATLCGRHPS